METTEEQRDERMKKFLQRHWKISLAGVLGIAVVAVVAIFVFLKVVADAQVLGFIPTTLGLWSVASFFTFIITVILWELILVGSWAIPITIITLILWYRKLPEEERKEYEGGSRRGRSAGEGGGVSFFVTVVWLIIVWITGRWTLAFQSWTFNDWIYTWLAACLWIVVPLCIAGLIYLLWTTRNVMEKES
ncbi:MAG: hypothetical protein ACFFD8_04975 [Candidatus Thorarchaeota archaeon]